VARSLASVTGYQALPPLYSLGYHYSKWDRETSANLIMNLNERFEETAFPVDVFWLDIGHTKSSEYFAFEKKLFSAKAIKLINNVLDYSQRRIVVITDPHVRKHGDYRLYKEGKEIESQRNESIFVRQQRGSARHYEGISWPGVSVWIDFLSPAAQRYWSSMYGRFEGTNSLYGVWVDMNEPAVGDGEEGTMPKTAYHIDGQGHEVPHRDVHNAYGLMMQRATYQGLIERDRGT